MPLSLLQSLNLAELASLDEAPEQAADWLMERDAAPADVLLMWGQEFSVEAGEWMDPRRWHWHLPQATLAVWAGCVYGAERRRAVHQWRKVMCGNTWDVTDNPHEGAIFRDQAAADRELRRRVARLFPEVRRLTPVLVGRNERWDGDTQALRAEDFVPPEPEGVSHIAPARPFFRDTGMLRRSINPGR